MSFLHEIFSFTGTYFYKPLMYATCCPPYTIRLEAKKFIANKTQRQVSIRFERYLECGSVLQIKQQEKREGRKNLHRNNTTNSEKVEKDDSNDTLTQLQAAHTLTVETVKPKNSLEAYELYRKYQIAVHGDDPKDITNRGFQRFLVDSPLKCDSSLVENKMKNITNKGSKDNNTDNNNTGSNIQYGTYHQLYKIDGRLVAVGVIDLLPSGLSSVYLFYDPEEKGLSLGRYTLPNDCLYG